MVHVMARTPIADRPLIAQWLIRTREQAGMTAEQFRAALAAEGKGVDYSTYAQWEAGTQTPKEDSLAPVFAFWRKRGAEPPTMEAPQRPPSLEERQLALLERQVIAAERQAAAMELHVRLLARQTIATEAMAVQQGATLPSSSDDWVALEDDLLALGQRVLADRRSLAPLSAHLPSGEG